MPVFAYEKFVAKTFNSLIINSPVFQKFVMGDRIAFFNEIL